MVDPDNLDCWPSDYNTMSMRKKHNIVAFYHQILWESQLCEDTQQSYPITSNFNRNSKGCRVSFSSDPPTIFEYEPEYSRTKIGIFDYQIFRRRFQQHHQQRKDEHRQFISSKIEERLKEEAHDEEEGDEYKNHRLMKTRSISEFRPIRNNKFNNNSSKTKKVTNIATSVASTEQNSPYSFPMNLFEHIPLEQIDIFHTDDHATLSTHHKITPHTYQQRHSSTSLPYDENDPPPTYISSVAINNGELKDEFFDKKINSVNSSTHDAYRGSGKNDATEKSQDSKGQAFFQRTLRKIKSSPKLIEIQRRSSSLRKKKSFSISTIA